VNLSVSRVGSAAQTKLMKRLTSQLRLSLARFRTMEHMVSQMSELEDDIQQFLKRGIATVEILKQN
jgi:F-type H+-transporting ATPase subunit alpha